MSRKSLFSIILFSFIILSGCSSSQSVGMEEYLETIQQNFRVDVEVHKYINEYTSHVSKGDSTEALDILKKEVIPRYKDLLKKYRKIELTNESHKPVNDQIKTILQLDIEQHTAIKELFENILKKKDIQFIDELIIDDEVKSVFDKTDELYDELMVLKNIVDDLSEKDDSISINDEFLETISESQLVNGIDLLITSFIWGVFDIEDGFQ